MKTLGVRQQWAMGVPRTQDASDGCQLRIGRNLVLSSDSRFPDGLHEYGTEL
jgi:hypothetical protein